MATLYVIATPIGNLEDISRRALRVLGEVPVLACEDTRITRRILARYEITRPRWILSYHEHNEVRAGARILQHLEDGRDVALCSDAGYPGISDPGFRVLNDVIEGGHQIVVIPGPGAIEPALVASALPTASFTFRGFAPRKGAARRRFLAAEADLPHTLVLFESPHRLAGLLRDALATLGDRRAAVCIELTKKFEEVHRGWLSELADAFRERTIRGEVTVVVAGNHPKFARVARAAGAREGVGDAVAGRRGSGSGHRRRAAPGDC